MSTVMKRAQRNKKGRNETGITNPGKREIELSCLTGASEAVILHSHRDSVIAEPVHIACESDKSEKGKPSFVL